MRFLLGFFIIFGLLTACANAPQPELTEISEQTQETTPPEPAAEIPQRPFPDDSVYPLLLAEFALRRRDYTVALDNYLQQSEQLRDIGVSAHTSRLAQYLKRDDDAIVATTLWVELEPENLEARLTLGNLLARRGDAAEALPHMAEIIRAGGAANFTALANGFSQMSHSARQKLVLEVDQLLTEFPGNTQLIICKALMLESMNNKQLALTELQTVFELEPRQLQAIVLDAKLRQDLHQKAGVYDRIEEALAGQPENDRLRTQYARLLTRSDIAKARQQFQILLDKSPSNPNVLFSLALIQREMGDLEAAKAKLEKLVGMGQRRNEAHYYLGRVAQQQGRYEDALMHYMRVEPGRDFVNATRRLANILAVARRLPEHIDYFNQLRERFPTQAEQLFAVEVESLNGQHLYTDAIEVLNQALRLLPDATNLQYMRSMALEKQGYMAAMEADLRAILEREPENSTVLNALGYTLANKTERYDEAQKLIEKALALAPDEPTILDSFGWVRFRVGDYEQALRYLRLAYQSFPDPEVAAHLGEVLWTSGDEESARDVWNGALSEYPDHEIITETMQRLGVSE